MTFALLCNEIVIAVDHKPKSSTNLKRFETSNNRGGLPTCLEQLCGKYEQYQAHRPRGAAILVEVDRFTGWLYGDGSSIVR